jgi:hypothetical protein
MLSFHQGRLSVDILQLVFDNLDVVLGRSQVILEFSFLGLLAGLRKFQLADILLQIGNRVDLGRVLVFEHFLRLPMSSGQELVNLNSNKARVITYV